MALIRHARDVDLPALDEIYGHYVLHTPITFDLEPPSRAARRAWFGQFAPAGRHQLFVAEQAGALLGYACSARFRARRAYDPSVETTVYVHPERLRRGVGAALYEALFDALASEDVHRAYAGITLPNPASVALHERFGFRAVGVLREVGRKFDRYWDVGWFERALGSG